MQDTALYLEADEDITSAIDKLKHSPASSVQIVVPKRSTMLQSIINLKLLKKAAQQSHKDLVLVTGDKIATDLAARVGLAVAPTLGAKAVLTEAKAPPGLKSTEEVIEADDPEPPADAKANDKADLSTGAAGAAVAGMAAGAALAGAPETAAASASEPPVPPTPPPGKPASRIRPPLLRRRELSDTPAPTPPAPSAPVAPEPPSPSDAPAGKGPKVPNFGSFQKRLKWIILAVAIVVGYFVFIALFTSAKVTLFANGTAAGIDTAFAVDTSTQTSSIPDGVLAGQTVTFTKDLTGSFAPTGTQNVGTQASGTMTVTNAFDESDHTFVSGTRFQAPDGNIFVTTADTTVPGATLALIGGHISLKPGTVTVNVQASQNGDNYNEAPATYTIPGLPAGEQSTTSGIYGQGSQMSGGTTKTVTVVAQSDVDTAKTAALAADAGNISKDLQGKLPSGYMEVSGSESTTTSDVTSSPAVNVQANTATISLKATYTVLAVKTSDYTALVTAQEQKQVGTNNQIYDTGISKAQVTSTGKDSSGRPTFHFSTTAFSGPKLDTKAIANQLKGQRYGDAASAASALPGVAQATISVWPPWSTHLPSRSSKITVVIKVAKQ
jgi:hypothetical protein